MNLKLFLYYQKQHEIIVECPRVRAKMTFVMLTEASLSSLSIILHDKNTQILATSLTLYNNEMRYDEQQMEYKLAHVHHKKTHTYVAMQIALFSP